jgi:LacI family transcriptional regulator
VATGDGVRQGRTSVTLRDVAERSGVSITTVSRILNGRVSGVPIREETRQRVLTAASEMGYKPNLLARGLRGSKSSLLGVIARDIGDPFHIQILRGINDAARERDYRLFLGHVDYQPDVALSYGSMFEQSHADGIILIGDMEGGEPALDMIAQQHRHVLGVTDRTARRQVPGIYADGGRGTQLALDHLWELGHRAITCVSDNRTQDGRQRIERYEEFMADRGEADLAQVYITDQEPEPALRLGNQIFDPSRGARMPTAIFATSDTTAIGLMQAAFQAGISIPDKLSIVGFDDIDFAAFTVPPLTTVSQSGVLMGRTAAERIFEMIEGDLDTADVADIVLPPSLVVRGSTGQPYR